MGWLERALPSCTSTVVPGGTHAFVYDKGGMEEVFAAAQKGVQEARVSEKEAGRRRRFDRFVGAADIPARARVRAVDRES